MPGDATRIEIKTLTIQKAESHADEGGVLNVLLQLNTLSFFTLKMNYYLTSVHTVH